MGYVVRLAPYVLSLLFAVVFLDLPSKLTANYIHPSPLSLTPNRYQPPPPPPPSSSSKKFSYPPPPPAEKKYKSKSLLQLGRPGKMPWPNKFTPKRSSPPPF